MTASQPARPSADQLNWQRNHQLGMFCHFGINTFYDKEWSDGTLDPAGFNPTALDCAQWVDAAVKAGFAHVILTAKHHDGFCLWPTATTDYSVRSSPWKDGTGDVVSELAAACRAAGIGLGLYLSPWDRHQESWKTDHAAYDALYLAQLTELCTNYGDLVEVWFDGAGSESHPYDWPAIMQVVHRHQPHALVFNMGSPTIRWVGNEDGLASDPCWYTVNSTHKSILDDTTDAIGGPAYLPPECDVAIRRHWFWHEDDTATLKSRQHLEAIWYRSVGLGANLLLNVPPDNRGLLDDRDRSRLVEFGETIRDRFADPVTGTITSDGSRRIVQFSDSVTFDHLWIEEAIEDGQRIRQHRVLDARTGQVLVDGVYTVGSQRVHAFPRVTTDAIVIEVDDPLATLSRVDAFLTGTETLPPLEDQPAFDSSLVG
jgi:alpha-L-fucosidase